MRYAILAAAMVGCTPNSTGSWSTKSPTEAEVAQARAEVGASAAGADDAARSAALCRALCGPVDPYGDPFPEPIECMLRPPTTPAQGAAAPSAPAQGEVEHAAPEPRWSLSCRGKNRGFGAGRRALGVSLDARARPEADALGAHFADCAALEAESVHAFGELAEQLAHHGAPKRLVEAARRAAAEERSHAWAMRRAATRRGCAPRFVASRRGVSLDLERLAAHNAVEGCVREAFGAALLWVSAARAPSAELRRSYARIARDETRHAELSAEVHRWALGRLSSAARSRVEAKRRAALRELVQRPPMLPAEARAALGLPDTVGLCAMARSMARALA